MCKPSCILLATVPPSSSLTSCVAVLRHANFVNRLVPCCTLQLYRPPPLMHTHFICILNPSATSRICANPKLGGHKLSFIGVDIEEVWMSDGATRPSHMLKFLQKCCLSIFVQWNVSSYLIIIAWILEQIKLFPSQNKQALYPLKERPNSHN